MKIDAVNPQAAADNPIKIREHQLLQQKISKLSVLVASQMDITSYHFDRFKVP